MPGGSGCVPSPWLVSVPPAARPDSPSSSPSRPHIDTCRPRGCAGHTGAGGAHWTCPEATLPQAAHVSCRCPPGPLLLTHFPGDMLVLLFVELRLRGFVTWFSLRLSQDEEPRSPTTRSSPRPNPLSSGPCGRGVPILCVCQLAPPPPARHPWILGDPADVLCSPRIRSGAGRGGGQLPWLFEDQRHTERDVWRFVQKWLG